MLLLIIQIIILIYIIFSIYFIFDIKRYNLNGCIDFVDTFDINEIKSKIRQIKSYTF